MAERTPLWDRHRAAGARMTAFHGFELPLWYRGLVEEHRKVRASAGLFDLCHMARLEIRGPDAVPFLDGLLTRSVSAIPIGAARYALLLAPSGGILDDLIAYRLADRILIVANAANRVRVRGWLERHAVTRRVEVIDRSRECAMIALQGPRAPRVLAPLWGGDPRAIEDLPGYRFLEGEVAGAPALVAHTGYTGERGFEIFADAARVGAVWDGLLRSGGDRVVPAGLGARDTLRLEAGMPLYGHEIDETVDPLSAGLAFAVDLDRRGFVGGDALRAIARDGPPRERRGFGLEGRRAAREGMPILRGGRRIGSVTSGAFSPTLRHPIAMGLLERGAPRDGLEVQIRGTRVPLVPMPLPFYRRGKRRAG